MYPKNNNNNGGDNLVVSQSCSMSKAVDDQQQQQQQLLEHNHHHHRHRQYEPDFPISAFRNLSLSHHCPLPAENGMNQLVDAAAAAYLPQTLDDYWPIPPRARNGPTQAIDKNNMMMGIMGGYYPPPRNHISLSPPSPYIGGGGGGGMAPQYPPNFYYNDNDDFYNDDALFAASPPNLASFPCNNNNNNHNNNNNDDLAFQDGSPPEKERAHITADMLPNILKYPFDYMTDSSLNRSLNNFLAKYSCTKFIDDLVIAITSSSKNCLVDAACNYYGSNLIQTLIKVAKKRPLIARVPKALAHATVLLMTDQSGLHVVKQCFIELEQDKYKPLYVQMMDGNSWFEIAKDKHGCRGLNDCLDYMVHEYKAHLLARIAATSKFLALDVYGTYIVQHVLDLQTGHTKQIVQCILPVLEVLCTTKNGSHLVEKCLDTHYGYLVIRELVEKHKLVRLALHECANYVIQKAIKRSRGIDTKLHERLVKILSRERNALQVNKHGKYVEKLLPGHQE